MSLLNWSEDLSVNINGVDAQHKKLINLINELHDAMKSGKGKDKMGLILNELVEYTKYHFSAEEFLMQQKNYPGFLQHKKEHDLFTQKVMEFYNKYTVGSLSLSLEVLQFLKDWIVNHIKGTDKQYSPYLSA